MMACGGRDYGARAVIRFFSFRLSPLVLVNRRLPRGDLLIKIPEGDPTQDITKLDRLSPNDHQESWSCSAISIVFVA
jgi:hypothetical protein